jgi:hypothetical protein
LKIRPKGAAGWAALGASWFLSVRGVRGFTIGSLGRKLMGRRPYFVCIAPR